MKRETVDQYLARGGQITVIETGLSGKDMSSRYDRKKGRGVNITLKKERLHAVNNPANS